MMKLMAWKLFPNNSRVFIGGWIIAAISILGLNLEKLGDLQYSPMVENSPLVNTIRLKHYHLRAGFIGTKSRFGYILGQAGVADKFN